MATMTWPKPMTVDEFLAWSADQPERPRYELVAGEPVAMAPEGAGHARLKGSTYQALVVAINKAKATCEAFPDGMTVRIDASTAYEPDAMVRCGPRLPDDAIEVPDPVIVVEVWSPWTKHIDTGAKLADYFRLPSVAHYLILAVDRRLVIHHARRPDGNQAIDTRIVTSGELQLDPPGLGLPLAAIYEK